MNLDAYRVAVETRCERTFTAVAREARPGGGGVDGRLARPGRWSYRPPTTALTEQHGESANTQYVHSVRLDCDGDTVLLEVDQVGAACHTGDRSCFDADLLLGPEE
jgi:hypothetical protein